MRDHLDRLSGTLPVVVAFTDDIARLAAYRRYLGIDFPVVTDPGRHLYRAAGAGRGSLTRVWSPGTIALYARLLRRGRRLRPVHDDTRQLGADILIDADGTIRRIWLPPSPDRRPPIEELIAAITELGG